MEQSSMVKLKERTGKTLAQWIADVNKNGPETEKERRDWLKDKGLTTNYTWWIAERAEGRGASEDYDPDAYVEAMFEGSKAPMRPVYEALVKLGLSMGKDVIACPCQTIVPFFRKHVFAQLKPSTRTRIDLGLALKDRKAVGRLIDTGGFAKKDRITHRIEVTSLDDIDAFAKKWLKTAYESNE